MYDDYEDNFQMTYAQREQMGGPQRDLFDDFIEIANNQGGLGRMNQIANRNHINPIDRFKTICNIFYNKLTNGNDGVFIIKKTQIVEKVQNLKWVEFKNPIAFIMGAFIVGKNDKIDPTRFNTLKIYRNNIPDAESIADEDIVRYGRIWESLLKK